MLSSEEAKELIALGRSAVKAVFRGERFFIPEDIKERFSEKRGVFTTLLTYPEGALRGCVGIVYPVYPLWKAVVDSSISSAFRDPRFEPLSEDEIDRVVWELSVLTPPQEVPKDGLPGIVKIGRDGLMVERGTHKGLLLPQVPLEHGWDALEFLRHTCLKAGLSEDCWKDPQTKVYRFSADIYLEREPKGEVVKVET